MYRAEQQSPVETFDRYFGEALFDPWARVLLEHASPAAGERVLDLACATGTVARRVSPLIGPRGAVVALDKNPGMLALGQTRPAPEGAKIAWRQGDAIALDLPDASFDLVLCQQGLQFFADRRAAVMEMRRVLAPEGRTALDIWGALDLHPVYEALCEAEARHLGVSLAEVAAPWSLPDGEEVRSLLQGAGFEEVQVTPSTLEAQFPSAERFVYLTLFAATAFMPEFDWDDEPLRTELIEFVTAEVEPVVERYRDGDTLTFPVHWNVATACVP